MKHSPVTSAFESLLVPLLPPAYGLALRMSRNREEAQDVVQESSLLAYRNFAQFQPGTNFKAWFFRIVTNCFLSRCRKRKSEPVMVDLEDAPEIYLFTQAQAGGMLEGDADPASSLLARMDSEQVAAAIAALPEEYRVVCVLYFMEDLAYQDIAGILEVPMGTVRSRLHRGRRMLQKALWHLAVEEGIVPRPSPDQEEA